MRGLQGAGHGGAVQAHAAPGAPVAEQRAPREAQGDHGGSAGFNSVRACGLYAYMRIIVRM